MPSASTRLRSEIAVLTILSMTAYLLVVLSPLAYGAAPGYQMPFPCKEVWQAATYTDHGGSGNDNPLDFNRADDYGDPVVASAGGQVTSANTSYTFPAGFYGGRYVVIDHDSPFDGTGYTTYYGHLNSVSVSVGVSVKPGDVIGAVGDSGHYFQDGEAVQVESHLHYEQREGGVAAAIVFDGAAVTYSYVYDGPSMTSKNCSGTEPSDSSDAGPALVVGSQGAVHSLHVSDDRCAKVYRRSLGASGFSPLVTLPSTCGWSLNGTHDMVMVPGENYQAWMALIRIGSNNCDELYLYKLNDATATQVGEVGASCGWGASSPPSMTVGSDGTVYIAHVKGGELYVFSRTAAGVWTNEGPLGAGGGWSATGTVAMEASPDGTIWLAAVKEEGSLWTFQRELNDNWANRGALGAGAWSPYASPGLAVDGNGHITVAAVEESDGSGSLMRSYRRCASCSAWHDLGQVGSSSQWSNEGTLAMTAAPDGRVWLVAVQHGNDAGAALYTLALTPDPNQSYLGSWSGAQKLGAYSDWSRHAAPAVTVAGGGTVFVSAVQKDGELWAFRRDAGTGGWSNYGQIGGSAWAGNN